jgi:hypothetical protein
MKLSPAQREKVRMMFGGRCAYCGIELPEKGWHADHVRAVRYAFEYRNSSGELWEYVPARVVRNGKVLRPENDVFENIFPSCRSCNIDKGAETLEDWREYLRDRMIDVMRRDIPNFRHAERFGRLTVVNGPLVFWFEKYRATR